MVQKKIHKWALNEPIISSSGIPVRVFKDRFMQQNKREPADVEIGEIKTHETTIDMLAIALDKIASEKGFDAFMRTKRIAEAVEKAKDSETINLTADDLSVLQKLLKENLPGIWALNKNICDAVEDFLEVKKDESDKDK